MAYTKKMKTSAHQTRKARKTTIKYLINDDNNNPFQVKVTGNFVEISKGERVEGDDYDQQRNYNQLVKKVTVKAVYPGDCKGPACDATRTGNSVLLHVNNKKCIYVGKEIYEFTMEDDIEAYYSPQTWGGVSYPVLLGKKYVYLMLEYVYFPRELFEKITTPVNWSDSYNYYYGHKDLKTGEYTVTGAKHEKPVKKSDTKPISNLKKIHRAIGL